jgi:glyoxylase-like metal-dependent hydrolase (beta-lactamase superfamily II)
MRFSWWTLDSDPRNGQTVLREVKKLSNADIYIVGTHFHSEHILGESAFPPTAKVIRARAQQRDIEEFGVQPNFATRSPAMAELMKDARSVQADELFDSEKTLDLGGVRSAFSGMGAPTLMATR